jgi:hypothetical protein
MSEKLPLSRPLGPRTCGETSLRGNSAKETARAVGALNSTIRASRPDILPIDVRTDQVTAREVSLHAAQQLSDFLQSIPVADRVEFETVDGLGSEVDALTLCEEQSRDTIAAMGGTGILEEELLEDGGFHVVKVNPIKYRSAFAAEDF